MTTLILGFVALVAVPALILSLVLTKRMKNPPDLGLQEEFPRFTLSSKS